MVSCAWPARANLWEGLTLSALGAYTEEELALGVIHSSTLSYKMSGTIYFKHLNTETSENENTCTSNAGVVNTLLNTISISMCATYPSSELLQYLDGCGWLRGNLLNWY
jgi:hypothetical protein